MCILALASCNSGPVVTQATGFAYEVIVVMDKQGWEAAAGEAVRADLASDVPGLPQSEPAMRITYVQPDDFDGLLRLVRNILVVRVDPAAYTKASFGYEENVWANNQLVARIAAPGMQEVTDYLRANPGLLSQFFTRVEINRAVAQLQKEYSTVVRDTLKAHLQVLLNAPAQMTHYKVAKDFFWASNDANTGRTDLLVYTFPYTDPETFTEDYLVAKRDSVLKANLPGAFPNSYMATERRAGLSYTPITVFGKYCGVLRGLWRMEGDMMGGPFVSHARLDEANRRVVVAEGFVYAPETDKRNFIRRIEAALYTLRLPDEFDKPAEEALPGKREAIN